jgi:hypothetical protein
LSRWAHIRSKDDLIAFTNGRQAGLRTASDAVDQLLDQLNVVREEHAAVAAQMKAESTWKSPPCVASWRRPAT